MAAVVYPAIAERTQTGFSLFFPDLPGCTTSGRTVSELALNAEIALTDHLLLTAQHGETVAPPSELGAIEADPEVVEAARLLVRGERPGKAVRLNIPLDDGRVAAIDSVASNRSGFLADAARMALAARKELAGG
jgi:predicted RNase H-like HicB family nuclease